ncbi:MAG: ATP-binding protein, partial [Actinomycetota bacterium]
MIDGECGDVAGLMPLGFEIQGMHRSVNGQIGVIVAVASDAVLMLSRVSQRRIDATVVAQSRREVERWESVVADLSAQRRHWPDRRCVVWSSGRFGVETATSVVAPLPWRAIRPGYSASARHNIDQVLDGDAPLDGVIVVSGPFGSGKSALVRAIITASPQHGVHSVLGADQFLEDADFFGAVLGEVCFSAEGLGTLLTLEDVSPVHFSESHADSKAAISMLAGMVESLARVGRSLTVVVSTTASVELLEST